jgi:hypothetical protein
MKETRRGDEITLSASVRDDKDFEKLMGRTAELLEETDPKRRNWIRTRTEPDRSAVELTMVIQGKDQAWISYNAEQLDELIRLLQSSRDELHV